jgi:hypothetical protein
MYPQPVAEPERRRRAERPGGGRHLQAKAAERGNPQGIPPRHASGGPPDVPIAAPV